MQFAYRARDMQGALITGEVEAPDLRAMQSQLTERGLIPIAIRELKPGAVTMAAIERWFNKVKAEELMVFTRQFYTLFKAGVSIDTILATLARQAMGKTLRTAIEKIRADIGKGASLSQAFRGHPHVFDELYISMMQAGEEAGILEQTLFELVKLIEKDHAIKRAIKSAMFYPKIVIFVLVGSISVLMTMVVPKFKEFFGHYKAELPMPTKILIQVSDFFVNFWFLIPVILGVCIFLFHRYASTKSGRYNLDRIRFQLPIFGPLTMKVANARFGHILSALYKSGLAMSRSLDVVANVIGNEAFALEVRLMRDDIQRGMGMADAMQQRLYFPPVVIETTAVGERTGSLDEMLLAVSEHFELEVTHTIKNLTTLLEPILLVVIFGMVTLVALAIFLPIWGMSAAVKGG